MQLSYTVMNRVILIWIQLSYTVLNGVILIWIQLGIAASIRVLLICRQQSHTVLNSSEQSDPKFGCKFSYTVLNRVILNLDTNSVTPLIVLNRVI